MTLADVWFVLVAALLTGYAVLDGFDLGAGVLYPFLGRTEEQKATIRNAIGPVWDGNEVFLVAGGGALFAAFPPVYAMTFSLRRQPAAGAARRRGPGQRHPRGAARRQR